MSEKRIEKVSGRMRIAFAFGEVGDNVALNVFNFLLFIFYFAVVGVPVLWISAGMILWSVWNAINDPLIGYLSDRTITKRGRRVPWMMVATIPLAILMILLFTPPVGLNSAILNFIYFMIILMIFDTVYTSFNLNYNALFSEMFVEMEDRAKTGKIRISFVYIATIFAFIFPLLIIEDLANIHNYPYTMGQYQLVGIISAIVILLTYGVILKWGVHEPKVFLKDAETAMGFKDTLKYTIKNKSFQWFLFPALGTWLCIGLLGTLVGLHAIFAIGVDEFGLLILLLVYFIFAAASTPLWEYIRKKKGARMSGIIGILAWAIPMIFYAFSTSFEMALIAMIFLGFGQGGGLYFYDQCIAEIIDEDEITHGTRRSGIYYAIINFLIRASAIINFVIIGVVFANVDWGTYTPQPGDQTILALRLLMGVYPAVVLAISLIGMYKYPIHGERLMENRRKLTELHEQKIKSLS